MADHTLMVMPKLDPQASVSGKCSCQRAHFGAHPDQASLEKAYEAHLREVNPDLAEAAEGEGE